MARNPRRARSRQRRHVALPLVAAAGRCTDGRHELGQNFLVDRRTIHAIAAAVPAAPALPVLELGAGDGAVTAALAASGRPVTAVELDETRADALRRRLPDVDVVHADMLRLRADTAHHVVSNVPFGITTPLLRHLLAQDRWHTAILLLQWEVARKRAGVGATTLLTAQWWPWVEFALLRRVPARAFRPVPTVDGGLLTLHRRQCPLVRVAERHAYQQLVRRVFDVGAVATSLEQRLSRRSARAWLADHGIDHRALARDLTPQHWAALHTLYSCGHGRSPHRPR